MDPASPKHAARPARLLAGLDWMGAEEAESAGVDLRTPAQTRQAWVDDVTRMRDAFTVAPAQTKAWRA